MFFWADVHHSRRLAGVTDERNYRPQMKNCFQNDDGDENLTMTHLIYLKKFKMRGMFQVSLRNDNYLQYLIHISISIHK